MDDNDLWKYSDEHVTYEVERFFWLTELLTDPSMPLSLASAEDTLRLYHALIEAFALHLRNLIEFLYPKKPRDSDIYAARFCAPGVWEQEGGAITKTLWDARERASKEIAHLTDKRIYGYQPAKEWPFKKLADEIRPITELLSAKALPSRLSPKVVRAIDIKPEKMSANKLPGIGPMPGPSPERPTGGMTGPLAPSGRKR